MKNNKLLTDAIDLLPKEHKKKLFWWVIFKPFKAKTFDLWIERGMYCTYAFKKAESITRSEYKLKQSE